MANYPPRPSRVLDTNETRGIHDFLILNGQKQVVKEMGRINDTLEDVQGRLLKTEGLAPGPGTPVIHNHISVSTAKEKKPNFIFRAFDGLFDGVTATVVIISAAGAAAYAGVLSADIITGNKVNMPTVEDVLKDNPSQLGFDTTSTQTTLPTGAVQSDYGEADSMPVVKCVTFDQDTGKQICMEGMLRWTGDDGIEHMAITGYGRTKTLLAVEGAYGTVNEYTYQEGQIGEWFSDPVACQSVIGRLVVAGTNSSGQESALPGVVVDSIFDSSNIAGGPICVKAIEQTGQSNG